MSLDTAGFVIQRRIPVRLDEVHRGLADRTPLGPTPWHSLVPHPSAPHPSEPHPSEPHPSEPVGFLYLDEPFRPVAALVGRQPGPTWRAPARLMTAGKRRVALVEIDVSMWSSDSTDLQLRPVARHPERWSRRRLRRYFTLAHLGADTTARLVSQRALDAVRAADARELELVAARRRGAQPVGCRN